MDQKLEPRWRPTGRQVLWGVGIAIALVVLILILYAYQWTGFGQSKVNEDIRPYKTLWDWLDLLIVPVVLAIGGYLFNGSQNRATREAAERRAQDDALQAYLDQMGEMILDKNHPLGEAPESSDQRILARARTLTVVERLDAFRKRSALGFLLEAGLLTPRPSSEDPVISLHQANLEGARLSDFWLIGSSLYGANLKGADLSRANLQDAKLFGANLEGANLRGAILDGANLGGANLKGANLYRDEITGVANEQELEERVGSLADTIMPDGTKHL